MEIAVSVRIFIIQIVQSRRPESLSIAGIEVQIFRQSLVGGNGWRYLALIGIVLVVPDAAHQQKTF